jgi:polysaccharide pyruvyl transferase WcaK-like protein
MSGRLSMRFLVYHGHFQNKGAEAMLRTIAAQVRRRLGPDTGFDYYFEVPAGEYAAEESDAGIVQAALPHAARITAVERIRLYAAMFRDGGAAGLARWRVRCHYHRAFDLLRGFDGLIDASGLAYSDAFGPEPARRAQRFWAAAAALRKPVVFMPQSWGPFESFGPLDRLALCRQLSRSAVVFARDGESIAHLRAIGADGASIRSCPDIVFTFDGQSGQAARPVRREPAVAIAPNMRLYDRTGGGEAANPYVGLLTEIAVRIANAGNALVLLPHEIIRDPRRGRDDRFLCGLLEEALVARGIAAERPDVTTAAAIREEIAACQAIVASRFHAAVLGLAAGVPAFLVGWQGKYAGLMQRFGMPECVAGIEDQASSRRGALLESVDSWLSRREEMAGRIRDQLPGIVREVEQAFDRVAAVLAAPGGSGGRRP